MAIGRRRSGRELRSAPLSAAELHYLWTALFRAPDMKIMNETDDERFERWLALDKRKTAGETLDFNDFDFHELFALSKTWRIKMAQHEAHLEQLEREEEIAKRLSK